MHNLLVGKTNVDLLNKQALGYISSGSIYQLLISKIAQYVSSPDTKCSLPRDFDVMTHRLIKMKFESKQQSKLTAKMIFLDSNNEGKYIFKIEMGNL